MFFDKIFICRPSRSKGQYLDDHWLLQLVFKFYTMMLHFINLSRSKEIKMKYLQILTGLIIVIGLFHGCSNDNEQQTTSNESTRHTSKQNNEEYSTNYMNFDEHEEIVNDADIIDDASITVLVNKQHSLDENYEPDDLVQVEVHTVLENPEINQLRKEAADALKEMFDRAAEEDIYLYARSGYRSYQTQVHLFENYVNQHGEEAANLFSAKPGQSEHQTGLAMDVTSESVDYQLTEKFGETKEGKWLHDHAHEFGFIIRYPENKEHITGYTYEPWHIRYLGVDLATKVKESGLTYEEFLAEEGIIHEVN